MMCAAPSPPDSAARDDDGLRHADPETRRFIRAMIARPATFTFVFLVACLFLFLLMKASGVDENPSGVLIAYGAKVNALIDRGEWWRFVAPIFLHGGPVIGWVHLLVNMYGLFMLGPYVEKLYGSAKFTFFWVFTGVGGTLGSYLTLRPEGGDGALERFLYRTADVPSVGASGALFGLVGVLFVFGIKFRHELPEGFKRTFGTGMLPMIVINLFIGYAIPIIDNAAHLGGLLAGMLAALFVGYKRPGPRGPVTYAWHAAQVLSLALVAVSFVMVALNFDRYSAAAGAEVPPPAVMRDEAGGRAFAEAMNGGREAFVKAVNDGDRAAAVGAAEKLSAVPPLGERPDALRDELKTLLTRAGDLALVTQAQGRAASEQRERQLKLLVTDYETWDSRFGEWVAAEGGEYGIGFKPTPPAAEEKK